MLQLESFTQTPQKSENVSELNAQLLSGDSYKEFLSVINSTKETTGTAGDKLPKIEVKDDAQEKAIEKALDQLTESLGHDIFVRGNTSKTGETFKVSESAKLDDSKDSLKAVITINTLDKGEPGPVILGPEPTTVTPSLDEGSFKFLQLSSRLEDALNGKDGGKPSNIKLDLGKEVLTGKMTISLVRDSK